MSPPYAILGNRPLDQWKVTELKEELKKRKLPTKGLKEELVKRLDEAVRSERESDTENMEDDENEGNQALLPSEKADTESDVSGETKDFTDIGISIDEKTDVVSEHEIDDQRSLFEGNVEVSLEQGTKAAELDDMHEAQDSAVETTALITETCETVTAVSEQHLQNDGTNDDGVSTDVSNSDVLPDVPQDAKLVLSDPKPQLSMTNESITPTVPSGGPNLGDNGTQDEALHSTIQMETEYSEHFRNDSHVQPLRHQVPEVVDHDLGFQVTSDSVSTDTITIIEKNELKVDVITDNVQLELDVKHETAQCIAVPDGGESHSLAVEEPLDKKDIEELHDKKDVQDPYNKEDVSGGEPLETKDVSGGEPLETKDVSGGEPLETKDVSEEPVDKKDVSEDLVGKKNTEEPCDELDVEEPVDKKDVSEETVDEKDVSEEPLDEKGVSEEPLNEKDDSEDLVDKKDAEEPCDERDVEEALGEKVSVEATGGSDTEMVDSIKNIDGEDLVPEKLNLDRSSGDDSMEEDIVESKPMDYKPDSSKIVGNLEKSGRPSLKEDHVDVVGHDKSVQTKPTKVENVSALTSVKRKFHDTPDKAAVGSNETVKKARRWNAEGLKCSEAHGGTTVISTTPKGLSQPTVKPLFGNNPTVHDEVPKERIVPTSLKPPTNSLRIDRFLRPFTLKQVQELLGKTGNVTGFWMDHIKTHCYVSYSSVEEAVETRNAVYNLQWPSNGGRLLVAEFVDSQEVKIRSEPPPAPSPITPSRSVPQNNAPPQPSPRQQQASRPHLPPPPPPPLSNPPPVQDRLHRENLVPREHLIPAMERPVNLPPPPPLPMKAELPIVTLDDLFRKTKATPRIYYLPLSDEQVAEKTKAQGKNGVNH